MASSSLLPNYALNKLVTPRLDVVNPEPSTNIEGLSPSYLYSIVSKINILNNFKIDSQNDNIAIISFNKSDLQIIEFTDRPFRQTGPFDTHNFIDLFKNGKTFEKVPPNAVFTIPKQGGLNSLLELVVELSLRSQTDTTVTFNLNVSDFSGIDKSLFNGSGYFGTEIINVSMFVDSNTSQNNAMISNEDRAMRDL